MSEGLALLSLLGISLTFALVIFVLLVELA